MSFKNTGTGSTLGPWHTHTHTHTHAESPDVILNGPAAVRHTHQTFFSQPACVWSSCWQLQLGPTSLIRPALGLTAATPPGSQSALAESPHLWVHALSCAGNNLAPYRQDPCIFTLRKLTADRLWDSILYAQTFGEKMSSISFMKSVDLLWNLESCLWRQHSPDQKLGIVKY